MSAVSRMMLQLIQVCAATVPQSSAAHSTAEPQPWAFPSLVESVETTSPLTRTVWV